MSAHAFRVGDVALHVERLLGGVPRLIRRSVIVRETRTQWIDDAGIRWRKSDGTMVPQYVSPRYLVPTTTGTRS